MVAGRVLLTKDPQLELAIAQRLELPHQAPDSEQASLTRGSSPSIFDHDAPSRLGLLPLREGVHTRQMCTTPLPCYYSVISTGSNATTPGTHKGHIVNASLESKELRLSLSILGVGQSRVVTGKSANYRPPHFLIWPGPAVLPAGQSRDPHPDPGGALRVAASPSLGNLWDESSSARSHGSWPVGACCVVCLLRLYFIHAPGPPAYMHVSHTRESP